jgi:hypothetical protein
MTCFARTDQTPAGAARGFGFGPRAGLQVIPSTTAATATTRIESAAVNAVTAEENHRIRRSLSRWRPARGSASGIAGRESMDIGQTFPAGTRVSRHAE